MPQPVVDLDALHRDDAGATATVELVLQPPVVDLRQRQSLCTLLRRNRRSQPRITHLKEGLGLPPEGSKLAQVGMKGKVAQSCQTLCDPMDCSLPGFSVHGTLQARNIGEGSCSLLQGIFLTWGSNPGLPHCGRIPY